MRHQNWTKDEDAILRSLYDTKTREQIAKILGRTKIAVKARAAHLKLRKSDVKAAEAYETTVGDQNKSTLEFTHATRIVTVDQLMEVCQVDLLEWEVERFVCNKWEVGAKDSEGNIAVEPLFQIKVWLTRNKQLSNVKRVLKLFEDAAAVHAPNYTALEYKSSREHIGVIPLPDAHFGKLAWAPETGEDYDIHIAQTLWKAAAEDLLPKANAYGLEKLYLVVGNDGINSDNQHGTTTGGTPQDNDSRIFKVFATVCMSHVWLIEKALLIAPVEVICVPGNHDELLSFMVAMFLRAWFRNHVSVTIDISPAKHKAIEYGSNLIMLTHGDSIKLKDIPLTLATEWPEAWGRTTFWEIITGHLHHERAFDDKSVIVRTCKALCSPDAWHKKKALWGRRGAEAFIYHKELGPVGHLIHNVPKTSEKNRKTLDLD